MLWGFHVSAEKQYNIAKLLCLYRKTKAWNLKLKQMQCQRPDWSDKLSENILPDKVDIPKERKIYTYILRQTNKNFKKQFH